MGQPPYSIAVAFVADSVTIEAGQTFSNDLLLINNGNSAIMIDSVKPAESYPGILFTPEFAGSLSPGGRQLLKIKMIADQALMQSGTRQIEYNIYYTDHAIKKVGKAAFRLVRPRADYLVIGTSSGEAYFNPAMNDNTISLFIENPGYETRNTVLKYRLLPDEYLTTTTQQEPLSLAPRKEN
ncbi:hypothetical protein LWM68_31710 [Niabella sp. W65]|nr:hypothetical protein [Niabella sp. W65]MCH7366932.1 hypothetical protein [Niabella sp. W65]ULT42625.1 hypothetical protein KRR40_03250 [Niabella sp. I65]